MNKKPKDSTFSAIMTVTEQNDNVKSLSDFIHTSTECLLSYAADKFSFPVISALLVLA